ncbi:hypothetical protein SEA_ADGERS_8 [Gordonia phage Adgers]|uniref:Uncharacterized protein n=1 Tax=Gordonia phage Adgers TaxID=2079413 RepID=A0A2L1IVC6_9CAUD|nr:hypothetical protein HWB50_gp008 [Gordonia phage Adgers]AVD99105.1 hypothetical protein SEA_ADGERS_8 [Gordonia phage Adgers]
MASSEERDPSVILLYANLDLEKVTEVGARLNAFAQSLSLDGYGSVVLFPDRNPSPCRKCGHVES